MNKHLILLVVYFLGIVFPLKAEETNASNADNNVYIEPISVQAGTQYTISVKMRNSVVAMGFGFDLYLPDGITVVSHGLSSNRLTDENQSYFYMAAPVASGAFKVAVTGLNGAKFTGNDGEVMTITIAVPVDFEQKEYPIMLKDVTVTDENSSGIDSDMIMSTITVTAPADPCTVLDETSTTVPESATNVDVRVKRTIKADEWSTICLPFSMTETQVKEAFGDNVQLGEFNGVDYEFDGDDVVGITVNFTNTQSIEANHPYIIKVSQPVSEFTLDGVDIVADEDEAYIEFDNGKTGSRRVVYSGFYGTYHAQTVLDKFTLFLSDNKFWYSMGQTTMKAFRAYFEFLDKLTDVENASNIKLWVNNDDEDGLQSLSGTPIMGENTYNLAGQRVGKNYKGIIIESGKKTIK
ncbi:MAG: hypothetical protein IKP36_01065 [Bacteroidaceae bacterium]|nr:hypothetical protein [Bacteroidaceae bacterium]